MDRKKLITEMQRRRLVAVVRAKSAKEALETAEAVAEGGIRFVEITFSVPGAVEVIETLSKRNDLHIGGGTVLSLADADGAISAGAEFIVSPTLEVNLIPICHKAKVACVSGAATPTELLTAKRAAADLVKIFPADTVGGPHFIRQMLGPFPDVRLMVSGGVDETNVNEYAEIGVVGICLGSAMLRGELMKNGRAGLAALARKYVDLLEQPRA
ncbi:MAG TPA: bifunctional 4-hydroxy-2-oxoglutarate aldolase/2-dehydro-3-deoxy-phosphogluconate aldolase [Verrucomicrobiae bacterium]|jgi:2-dehydro-3-deoxyphosphogluconate aldolase / (4S)-4-hydroxy-2-oxoglutarate aldolase|nr:bifunctional 4-hydroxy-2-oxoglutarate aldolase/2-dehydro-3-deoxy-phosphogluconate aldolase [Verrucomicrobiae bacterium]